jgi:uncharacterized protein
MRLNGRRYRDEWIPNFYPARKLKDCAIRISRSGAAILLTHDEDAQIDEFFMEDAIFERLERTGHIITQLNSSKALPRLATWLKGTYDGPGLHIVVPTRRCNLNCTYCHMLPQPIESQKDNTDLALQTIPLIAKFIMSTPRESIGVEFQGGEPFLNFPAMVTMVEEIGRLNESAGKKITFSAVSNLMVVNDEHLDYCAANKLKLSYSLNGPQQWHDLFRITRNGSGSHEIVTRKVSDINRRYPGLLGSYPLCVVTEDNMSHVIDLAKYYFDLGFTELALIHLKNLGNARGRVHFSMREFAPYYITLLDYIYEKNRTSGRTCYTERIVRIALTKIFSDINPSFIDWRNPIGYVSNCLVYDYDGEILPVDEARSFKDVFSLGNVKDMTYNELVRRRSTYYTVNESIRDRDPVCRECAYNPYCGTSPVLNYAKTGELKPEPFVNDECVLVQIVFDWVFEKLSRPDLMPLLKMVPELVPSIVEQLRSRA